MSQRVIVSGSSGLIGGALCHALRARGDEVVRLVRHEPSAPDEARWDPAQGQLNPELLQGVSAFVNLNGVGVGDHRWTDAYKKQILDSRVDSTRTAATAIAAADGPVRLVNASAMGFYGDRGETVVDESASVGTGFLAHVVQAWEDATAPAAAAGQSVAMARTGLVFASEGGALGQVLPLAKLGLAGPLGSGKQWWSWISLRDEVSAFVHLIDHPEVTGPVNLVGPHPVRQKDAMKALGAALNRPARLPAPRLALRLVLGEFAGDILASTKVEPAVLRDSGFTWQDRTVQESIESALSR